jgi:type III secretory pathway component EscU
MNKFLNIATAIYGGLLFISGIVKLMGGLNTLEFHIGEKYLTVNNSTSLFYIIAVNFLGGAAFLYHALMTLKFKNVRQNYINNPDKTVNSNDIEFTEPLSKTVFLSGVFTFLICFFLFIKAVFLIGSFEYYVTEYILLLVVTILIYVPYAVIPVILVFENIDLNRQVEAKHKKLRMRKK